MIWLNSVIVSTTTDKRNQRVAMKLTNSKFSLSVFGNNTVSSGNFYGESTCTYKMKFKPCSLERKKLLSEFAKSDFQKSAPTRTLESA